MADRVAPHGIYEITRLEPDVEQPILIPADKMERIAGKLRTTFVQLQRISVGSQVAKDLKTFMSKYKFDKLLLGKGKPRDTMIAVQDRAVLNKASYTIYKHSFNTAKKAKSFNDGGSYSIIGSDQLRHG